METRPHLNFTGSRHVYSRALCTYVRADLVLRSRSHETSARAAGGERACNVGAAARAISTNDSYRCESTIGRPPARAQSPFDVYSRMVPFAFPETARGSRIPRRPPRRYANGIRNVNYTPVELYRILTRNALQFSAVRLHRQLPEALSEPKYRNLSTIVTRLELFPSPSARARHRSPYGFRE